MTQPLSVTLTHTFAAPIDLVYQAWVDPQMVVKWMKCEPGVELTYEGWSPAVGATYTSLMRKPGEWEVRGSGEFTEVDPPHVLAFRQNAEPEMNMPETTDLRSTIPIGSASTAPAGRRPGQRATGRHGRGGVG